MDLTQSTLILTPLTLSEVRGSIEGGWTGSEFVKVTVSKES